MKEADNSVKLYPDGKYRWVYEVPMLTNPSILFDVYKVLGISFFVVWIFNITLISCEDGLSLSSVWESTKFFLLLMLFIFALGVIAYIIVAWTYGWKYLVVFTMDEKEIVHQQMSKQVKKAKVLGALTVLAGAAAGKPGVMGAGVLSASRISTTSVLENVKKLVPQRRLHLIKVNQLLNHNRIYVGDEDFDFVYDFLCKHCTKAKKVNSWLN